MEESFDAELKDSWNDASVEGPASTIAETDNVIGSHVVFKIKDGDNGELRLKGRLVLHGNRDGVRFKVRCDSASADVAVVMLLLLLAPVLGIDIVTADVKEAYMQSGPVWRQLYVKPPKQKACRNTVRNLVRLSYGLVEVGSQWICAENQWLIVDFWAEETTRSVPTILQARVRWQYYVVCR